MTRRSCGASACGISPFSITPSIETGRFRNFPVACAALAGALRIGGQPGASLWALGAMVGRAGDPGRQSLAGDLFHGAIPAVTAFTSPRAWAYALLGLDEHLKAFQETARPKPDVRELADRLLGLFQRTSRPDWPWFEDRVTYCNRRPSRR